MNSSNNLSVSALSSGDYVGYGKVTKIQVDGSGNEKGRITSNYSINPDISYNLWQDQLPVPIPTTKSGGIENGKLLSQAYLDNNGIKIREITNEYNTKYSDIYYGTIFQPISESMYVCKGWTNGGSLPPGTGTPDASSTLGVSVVAHYPVFSKESLLSTSKITDFINGKELVTNTRQYFNSNNFITSKATDFPDNSSNSQNVNYSTEKGNLKLINANIINVPLETFAVNSNNGVSKTVSHTETKYDNPNHLNPTSVLSYSLEGGNTTEATYNIYDNGRLLQYTNKDGIPVTIIWGYNKTQPIAKIEGGNYSQIMQAFGLNGNDSTAYLQLDIVKKSDLDIDETTEGIFVSVLNNFKNKDEFKDFKITTYTYDPLIGVKTITQPSGLTEIYKYDTSGRLERILGNDNKTIKEYKYNYGPVRYYSRAAGQMLYKNNCGPSALGGSYTYNVAEGKYISIISQADADQQAQNDINVNGQIAANTNGTCTTLNCTVTKGSGINQFNYGSIYLNDPSTLRIAMGFRYNSSLSWNTGVIIGKINGNCVPAGERSSSTYVNGVWMLTIDTNGNIIAKVSSASPSLVNNMDLTFDFTFSIN
jgi:hypothetical protein